MKNDQTTEYKMNEILLARDRLRWEVRGVGGVLTHLFRTILMELGIGLLEFNQATLQYILKARREQIANKVASYFNRSNIYREMSKPAMTFKVFMKALKIIGVTHLSLSVNLTRKGRVTTHTVSVSLGSEGGFKAEDFMEGRDDDDVPDNAQATWSQAIRREPPAGALPAPNPPGPTTS